MPSYSVIVLGTDANGQSGYFLAEELHCTAIGAEEGLHRIAACQEAAESGLTHPLLTVVDPQEVFRLRTALEQIGLEDIYSLVAKMKDLPARRHFLQTFEREDGQLGIRRVNQLADDPMSPAEAFGEHHGLSCLLFDLDQCRELHRMVQAQKRLVDKENRQHIEPCEAKLRITGSAVFGDPDNLNYVDAYRAQRAEDTARVDQFLADKDSSRADIRRSAATPKPATDEIDLSP